MSDLGTWYTLLLESISKSVYLAEILSSSCIKKITCLSSWIPSPLGSDWLLLDLRFIKLKIHPQSIRDFCSNYIFINCTNFTGNALCASARLHSDPGLFFRHSQYVAQSNTAPGRQEARSQYRQKAAAWQSLCFPAPRSHSGGTTQFSLMNLLQSK